MLHKYVLCSHTLSGAVDVHTDIWTPTASFVTLLEAPLACGSLLWGQPLDAG